MLIRQDKKIIIYLWILSFICKFHIATESYDILTNLNNNGADGSVGRARMAIRNQRTINRKKSLTRDSFMSFRRRTHAIPLRSLVSQLPNVAFPGNPDNKWGSTGKSPQDTFRKCENEKWLDVLEAFAVLADTEILETVLVASEQIRNRNSDGFDALPELFNFRIWCRKKENQDYLTVLADFVKPNLIFSDWTDVTSRLQISFEMVRSPIYRKENNNGSEPISYRRGPIKISCKYWDPQAFSWMDEVDNIYLVKKGSWVEKQMIKHGPFYFKSAEKEVGVPNHNDNNDVDYEVENDLENEMENGDNDSRFESVTPLPAVSPDALGLSHLELNEKDDESILSEILGSYRAPSRIFHRSGRVPPPPLVFPSFRDVVDDIKPVSLPNSNNVPRRDAGMSALGKATDDSKSTWYLTKLDGPIQWSRVMHQTLQMEVETPPISIFFKPSKLSFEHQVKALTVATKLPFMPTSLLPESMDNKDDILLRNLENAYYQAPFLPVFEISQAAHNSRIQYDITRLPSSQIPELAAGQQLKIQKILMYRDKNNGLGSRKTFLTVPRIFLYSYTDNFYYLLQIDRDSELDWAYFLHYEPNGNLALCYRLIEDAGVWTQILDLKNDCSPAPIRVETLNSTSAPLKSNRQNNQEYKSFYSLFGEPDFEHICDIPEEIPKNPKFWKRFFKKS